eukprot:g33878.t1
MAKSGLKVPAELLASFKKFSDAESKTRWCAVTIEGEEYKLISSGEDPGDNWENIAKACPEDQPLYFFLRVDKKWLMIFWCPDSAAVRQRMMFSSSMAGLRSGFPGVEWHEPNFRCSLVKEVTKKHWKESVKDVDEQELMTYEEILKKEAAADSIAVGALSESKVSAIVGLPIKVDDAAMAAVKGFMEGGDNLVFSMNGETETLCLVTHNNDTLEDTSKTLVDDEPRFILHDFAHEKGEEQAKALVFIYYCPENAKPRKKMFYSSCKSVVMNLLQNNGIEVQKSIECSEPSEVSHAAVLDELYPKKAVKETFAKPTRKGGGKKPMPVKKFQPK